MSVSLAATSSTKSISTGHGQSSYRDGGVEQPRLIPCDERNELELGGVVTRVAADCRVYAEGDAARSFYKVVSGVVRICRFLSDGRRQIDAFHMAGEVFGLEPGMYHPMTAEAVCECSLVAYRRRGLESMVAHDDRLSRWFFSYMMDCIAMSRERSLRLGRGGALQKVVSFLLEIADRNAGTSVIDLAMSRQDIADYLGLTIETVSRTLSQLERAGVIRLQTARRVVLLDRRVLPGMLV